MEKIKNYSTPLAIIIAGLLIAGAVMYRDTQPAVPTDQNQENLAAVRKVDPKTDHIRGDAKAPVIIIEYSDLECPFCKRFHETMNQVYAKYGTTGQIAWVYRHFPLDNIHPKARQEAAAAECAGKLGGNDAFWQYIDKVFAITPANNGLDLAELPKIAQEIGLDVTKFNTCLNSGEMDKKVDNDYQNGIAAGAQGTPFPIVINAKGERSSLPGALQFDAMEQVIAEALKK